MENKENFNEPIDNSADQIVQEEINEKSPKKSWKREVLDWVVSIALAAMVAETIK